MNEIERINEFREIVHVKLKKKQFYRIIFACLVSFFFELINLFLFHNNKFYCKKVIKCRLNEFKICTAIKKLSFFKCVFLNDNEFFEHFESNNDCCEKCQRY